MHAMNKIVDAVTAVLCYQGQILLVRRQPFLRAFSGYHAFPGGKVDPEDAQGTTPDARWHGFDPRIVRALLREISEEVNLDLAAHPDWIKAVRHLGIALTPAPAPVRFNTHFFHVELDHCGTLTPDLHEISDCEWASAAQWGQRYEEGEVLLAPPTLHTLQALAADANAMSVPALAHENRFPYELPLLETLRGVRQILVRSHTLPPAQHTNCFLLGDAQTHRVLVDPSPADEDELERLVAVVGRFGIHEIFITHHHADHHERANVLARRLQVPIGMSADTQTRIRARQPHYFDELTVNAYQQGDAVCRWQGHAVRVLEVPGHDEGQLALMPENRAWCIVGDLIQGIGTVVIAEPEGHMGRYYQSLEKIIALAPRAIFPSHGMALGGTYRLSATLKHRQQREQQILMLHQQGHDPDAMLPIIYAEVDPRLLPLARMNILSHLHKLREEGVIHG